jgi:hypothetical protein
MPLALPAPRYVRCRRRLFRFPHSPQTRRVPPPLVVRPSGITPSVRPTSPLPPLPWLHQSHDRADTSHYHQPRCQVRPPLTKLSAERPLLAEGDLAPFFFDSSSPPPGTEAYQPFIIDALKSRPAYFLEKSYAASYETKNMP